VIYPLEAWNDRLKINRENILMLVSAIAGIEAIRQVYQAAIFERYLFFSYGDAMLII